MEPEVAAVPSSVAPAMSFSLPEPVSAVATPDKKKKENQEVTEVSVLEAGKGLSESIRSQAQSTSASVVANLENIEKTTVMNKIASLRNEIKNDEKYLDNTKKYREEVKKKSPSKNLKSMNTKNDSVRVPITSEENDNDLEIVSDDETTSENSLRLRKPEKRGIMSRNPGAGDSRRQGRDSKIPDRVLYMDKVGGVKERERGRAESRDDRRGSRGESRDERRGNREESRDDRRGARDEERDGRRGGDSRRRSRSRDRGGSRRGRSGSRERVRPRSVSPYVVAMESWTKFKKAEKEMLAKISKRRDTFEKRPEDHPKYAEEWKSFWERRYKELQSQGRNPNNHDFKAEWIPYWTKHVSDLFDSEVLDKTNDLLRKHNLKSVTEPKRDDFPSQAPKRRRSRSKERRRSPDRRRSPGGRNRSRSRDKRNTEPLQVWEAQASNQFRQSNQLNRFDNMSQGPPVDWQQQEMLARDLDRFGPNNNFGNNFGGNQNMQEHMLGRGQGPFGNEMNRNRNILNENCFEQNEHQLDRERRNFDRNFGSERNEGRDSRFQDIEERPSRLTRSDGRPSRFDGPSSIEQFRPDRSPPLTQVANFGRHQDNAPPQMAPFGQFGKRPEAGRGQSSGSLFPIARAPAPDVSEVRQESNDVYSGLSELEATRDRGRSRTPSGELSSKLGKLAEAETSDSVHVVQCLRVLSALEDSLGSLGPSVNRILGKALSIENSREGASKVLLEDPDTVSILEMVKEKLSGLVMAGLLEGSRTGAVKVCLGHLTKLLSVATKKRSENFTSLIQDSPAKRDSGDRDEEARARALIAETLASSLIQAGEGDISDHDLEMIVEELMRMTAQDDPESSVGKYARAFLQTSAVENQLGSSYRTHQRFQNIKQEKDIQVVTLDDKPKNSSDSFEELTVDDLTSLLRSFNTLSKQEQNDLINYMKKLEATDPEKVKMLKEGMKKSDQDQEGSASRKRSDWSPSPFNKRPRRLSGSDLEMNPVNPEPQQAEPNQDPEAGKWRTVDTESEPPRFGQATASFGGPGLQGRGSGWRDRGQEEADLDQIPLNPLYTSRHQGWGHRGQMSSEGQQGMNQVNPMNTINPSNPMNQENPMYQRHGFPNNRNQNYDNW